MRCFQCWDRRFLDVNVQGNSGSVALTDAIGGPSPTPLLPHGSSASSGAVVAEEDTGPDFRIRVENFEIGRWGSTRHCCFTMQVSRGEAQWPIRRRFRQVYLLHRQLAQTLGWSMGRGLPRLPPRVTPSSFVYGHLDRRFLNARIARLQLYFDQLLRYIPFVDQCEALRDFLCNVDFSHMSYDDLLDLGSAVGRVRTEPIIDLVQIEALPKRAELPSCGTAAGCCCVICQEPLEDEDKDIRVLPCGHEYHYKCIAKWIPQSNTCCICHGVAVLPSPSEVVEKDKP